MMKKKWIIGIGIGAVLLVGGSYGLTQYQTHAKAEEEQQTFDQQQDKLAKQVASYKKEAAAFYLTAKKERLAQDVTAEQVTALASKLDGLEGKEMRVAIAEKLNTTIVDTAYAEKMVALRDKVNGLLDKNGSLAEKANVAAVEKQATGLKEAKPVFYVEQNKIIQQAKQQQAQIKKANEAVDALFTDTSRKTIKSNVTRAQFQSALKEKNKVKQVKAKQVLIQDLNRVESYLTAQEKQAAERQAQAAQAQEKANIPQANEQSSSAKSSTPATSQGGGSSTNGYSSSNKSSGSSSAPSSSYTAPRSSSQGSTSSSQRKSTSGSSSSSSGSSSATKKPSNNGGSSSNSGNDEMEPGDSWDIDWTEGGYIDGEDGNTWQGGSW